MMGANSVQSGGGATVASFVIIRHKKLKSVGHVAAAIQHNSRGMDSYLERDHDRALFGLPPIQPKPQVQG